MPAVCVRPHREKRARAGTCGAHSGAAHTTSRPPSQPSPSCPSPIAPPTPSARARRRPRARTPRHVRRFTATRGSELGRDGRCPPAAAVGAHVRRGWRPGLPARLLHPIGCSAAFGGGAPPRPGGPIVIASAGARPRRSAWAAAGCQRATQPGAQHRQARRQGGWAHVVQAALVRRGCGRCCGLRHERHQGRADTAGGRIPSAAHQHRWWGTRACVQGRSMHAERSRLRTHHPKQSSGGVASSRVGGAGGKSPRPCWRHMHVDIRAALQTCFRACGVLNGLGFLVCAAVS